MTRNADRFFLSAAALYPAHMVGDHWVQTNKQAAAKGKPGREGHAACAAHVATLTLTKAAALTVASRVTGTPLSARRVVVALAFDAATHYWADRRTPLRKLAARTGKSGFYELGAPRSGHDDAPHLGTGAYALDQSWHIGSLFITALIIGA